jgi:hypothetical protein
MEPAAVSTPERTLGKYAVRCTRKRTLLRSIERMRNAIVSRIIEVSAAKSRSVHNVEHSRCVDADSVRSGEALAAPEAIAALTQALVDDALTF